jgi:hypothetical protein
MKYCIFIWLLISLCRPAIQAQKTYHSNKRDEKWAIELIAALPEVKDFMRYARKNKPQLMVEDDPGPVTKYYCIAVGIGNFNMFRTTMRYYIDPKTCRIYIDDVMDNSTDALWHIIPLEKYRHWRYDPRFRNYHTFKGNKIIALDSKGNAIHGTK